jgi:hypothetical protein
MWWWQEQVMQLGDSADAAWSRSGGATATCHCTSAGVVLPAAAAARNKVSGYLWLQLYVITVVFYTMLLLANVVLWDVILHYQQCSW